MKNYTKITIAMLLAAACMAQMPAAIPQPKSPKALDAIKKSDLAIKKARDQYREAYIGIKRVMIKDLEDSLVAAMKSTNLDEANAIKAKINESQKEIEFLLLSEKSIKFVIMANKINDTIRVEAGQKYIIRAEGTKWSSTSHGPGSDPFKSEQYIKGTVGGTSFKIDRYNEFVPTESGMLTICMGNENEFKDNWGSVNVTIFLPTLSPPINEEK